MKILFLDDDPVRFANFSKKVSVEIIWVQTASQAISQLKTNTFDIIFLDHDLGGKVFVESGKGTGYEVAQWISNNMNDIPRVIIHSMNPAGAKNMANVLSKAEIIPFYNLINMIS